MSSGTSYYLYGVWGSSDNDVYAVGWKGTILHYDGSAWSTMRSGGGYLVGVWGSSGGDVYAVGESGTILHYDGSAWSTMRSGTSSYLSGVWGSSGSDVYAVGESGTILHYPPSPDLSLLKEVAPAGLILYRGAVTYTVGLGNHGSLDAGGVTFTDTLPARVDFGRWIEKPGGANVSNDQITWSGTVTAGQAITFTFVVHHVGMYGDVVTNTARYSHASGSGSDEAAFTVEARRTVFLPLVLSHCAPCPGRTG
jgi:hypothetical protein